MWMKKLFKWLIILFSLVAIQTLTYFTIGKKQLKDKLLPEYFAGLTHHSDSVFVRDFVVAEDFVGDPKVYYSHNLSNNADYLKKKFGVNYVYFDTIQNYKWNDSTESQYNLIYNTWYASVTTI